MTSDSPHTHTAIATTSKGVLDTITVLTEKPGPGEILLKTEYASMIAFDTYMTDRGYFVKEYPVTLGFNASGTVHAVGRDVHDLAVGDRVTAFAFPDSRSKAMQEYSILHHTKCAKIPDSLALDAAVTIPDNFVTAFWALSGSLKLSLPSTFPAITPPPSANQPILLYGAGATSGQYAIQLMKLAGYTKILATASPKHNDYLLSLGATRIFDYNSPTLARDIEHFAGGKVPLVLDCITAEGTLAATSEFISADGSVALLLPIKAGNTVTGPGEMSMSVLDSQKIFPDMVKLIGVETFKYQTDENLKTNLMPNILPALLSTNQIQPNRVRLLDQGTFIERVETGLDLLRNNRVSGEKIVVKIRA